MYPNIFQPSSSLLLTSFALLRTRTFGASPHKKVISISTCGCCYDPSNKPYCVAALYFRLPKQLEVIPTVSCFQHYVSLQSKRTSHKSIHKEGNATSLHVGNCFHPERCIPLLPGDENVVRRPSSIDSCHMWLDKQPC